MSFISDATLEEADKEIFDLVEAEKERQTDHLEMIASENFTSP
ncbi:serine hydroxymethyltransferase, partial [Halarcobacter ebronensis]